LELGCINVSKRCAGQGFGPSYVQPSKLVGGEKGGGRGEGGGGGGRPDKGQPLVLRFGVGDGANHPNM